MEKLPEQVVTQKDGTIKICEMLVSFYKCRVAASNKCKVQMYGTMVRCELAESRKGNKKYVTENVDLNSQNVLRVFDPKLYLTKTRNGGTVSQLMPDHVQECAEYFATQKRYIHWLKTGFTYGLL